ncbi:hypothetical protein [Thiocapsa sp.]|uniref:hypothetical protein n=1 Tax=Thiocapsa sp. TaxID=2024551 RepID=UPI002BE86C49|nr:hypothetical protein [Thiocapsa sp.]HSO84258.1 hypothetical protein [Thiocapsa sp.]
MKAAHSALDEIVDIREPETPRTDDEFERGFGAMLARRAQAATGLSQQNFAEQFGIPAGSFRDWE